MGRCAPFFVWKSPGSTEPCAARPTRAPFPAPFLRALPLPPPSDLPVAPKESAFALGVNRIKVNNTMRNVHRKLGTDEHTLPCVFLGEKHHIPNITEPLSHYDFFRPPVAVRVGAVVMIALVLSLEFFNMNALRVRRAARIREVETEYVFDFAS